MTDIDSKPITVNCPTDKLSSADHEVVTLRLLGEQKTILDIDWRFKHRSHHIKYVISGNEPHWYVNGFRTLVAFISTGQWWIVADDPLYDLMFKDIGPFVTATAALDFLKAEHEHRLDGQIE